MKRMRRDNLIKRTAAILGNNEGASLVLVSILAILVLLSVVILRLATTTFMASSNRQLNQDQAYELAASLGASIDALIDEGKYDLDSIVSDKRIYPTKKDDPEEDEEWKKIPELRNAKVKAYICIKSGAKVLEVTAIVGKAQYIYTKEYAA